MLTTDRRTIWCISDLLQLEEPALQHGESTGPLSKLFLQTDHGHVTADRGPAQGHTGSDVNTQHT